MIRDHALDVPFRTAKGGFRALVAALVAIVTRWAVRRRTRRALRDLPEHLLRDIGLSREAADAEARRPFWL
jgi:uncharacterized protein YjiS (DUF1127 family)